MIARFLAFVAFERYLGRNFMTRPLSVSCPRNKHIFRCDQNGRPARREEGACLNGYVTDEQRGRPPIFIATPWAAASWLFFHVVRSLRIDLDTRVAPASKNSQLTCGERHAYFGGRILVCLVLIACVLCGCDNRTRDDKVFDQIAETQKSDKGAQPFKEAQDPWSSAEYHKGLAW
jgi:hypothetical protein